MTAKDNRLGDRPFLFTAGLVVLICLIAGNLFGKPEWEDPDFALSTYHLIRSKGYPAENHTVVTSDGYVLELHRIPYGRNTVNHDLKRPVVFLQHGLLCSSSDWVINFPDSSLAFILADHGFDVWLGNTRGNTYSRKHVSLSPEDTTFWKFSYDDVALTDLPESIDYVLKWTAQESLSFVAHSAGTGSMFALLAEKTQYNKKVKVVAALAPTAVPGHSKSPIVYLGAGNIIGDLTGLVGTKGDFLNNNWFVKTFARTVCGHDLTNTIFCYPIFLFIEGFTTHRNMSRMSVYLSHLPAGTSTYAMHQVTQLKISNKMQKYDFGTQGNLIKYKKESPPTYNIGLIETPVGLFSSDYDGITVQEDNEFFRKGIPNIVLDYRVPAKHFTHFDFTHAIDANVLIYPKVLKLLEQYSS